MSENRLEMLKKLRDEMHGPLFVEELDKANLDHLKHAIRAAHERRIGLLRVDITHQQVNVFAEAYDYQSMQDLQRNFHQLNVMEPNDFAKLYANIIRDRERLVTFFTAYYQSLKDVDERARLTHEERLKREYELKSEYEYKYRGRY